MPKKRPAEKQPPQPSHVKGANKGEEMTLEKGKEPGRGEAAGSTSYRSARDSTSINPDRRNPIHPDMPNIPPQ